MRKKIGYPRSFLFFAVIHTFCVSPLLGEKETSPPTTQDRPAVLSPAPKNGLSFAGLLFGRSPEPNAKLAEDLKSYQEILTKQGSGQPLTTQEKNLSQSLRAKFDILRIKIDKAAKGTPINSSDNVEAMKRDYAQMQPVMDPPKIRRSSSISSSSSISANVPSNPPSNLPSNPPSQTSNRKTMPPAEASFLQKTQRALKEKAEKTSLTLKKALEKPKAALRKMEDKRTLQKALQKEKRGLKLTPHQQGLLEAKRSEITNEARKLGRKRADLDETISFLPQASTDMFKSDKKRIKTEERKIQAKAKKYNLSEGVDSKAHQKTYESQISHARDQAAEHTAAVAALKKQQDDAAAAARKQEEQEKISAQRAAQNKKNKEQQKALEAQEKERERERQEKLEKKRDQEWAERAAPRKAALKKQMDHAKKIQDYQNIQERRKENIRKIAAKRRAKWGQQ